MQPREYSPVTARLKRNGIGVEIIGESRPRQEPHLGEPAKGTLSQSDFAGIAGRSDPVRINRVVSVTSPKNGS
jgi:hypothetical protein